MGGLLSSLPPLEASMTSPFSVLVCTLCWELLYQTLGLFFQLAAPRLVLRSHSKGYSSMANHGHSYACALIHAVVVTARGLQHLAGLVGAPAEVQMMSPMGPGEPGYELAHPTQLTNLLFFSWLCYDICHIISWYPQLGGADTVAHHVGFAIVSAIHGLTGCLPLPFAWLITTELSSPFLNIRWFLINSGRGDTGMMHATNVAFALSFFLSRVLLYGVGVVHLALHTPHLFSAALRPRLSPYLAAIVCAQILFGYGLNLTWASKIYKMATATRQGGAGDARPAPPRPRPRRGPACPREERRPSPQAGPTSGSRSTRPTGRLSRRRSRPTSPRTSPRCGWRRPCEDSQFCGDETSRRDGGRRRSSAAGGVHTKLSSSVFAMRPSVSRPRARGVSEAVRAETSGH